MSATTSRISLKLIQNLLTQDMAQGFFLIILYMFIRGGGGGGGGGGKWPNSHIRKLFLSKMGQIIHIQKFKKNSISEAFSLALTLIILSGLYVHQYVLSRWSWLLVIQSVKTNNKTFTNCHMMFQKKPEWFLWWNKRNEKLRREKRSL